MHEAGLARELVEAVERELALKGTGGRVVRIEVLLGRLSGMSPEALRFGFEHNSAGTRLAGAALEITETGATGRCRSCGAESETDELPALCPRCGGADVEVELGRGLVLRSIEFEE